MKFTLQTKKNTTIQGAIEENCSVYQGAGPNNGHSQGEGDKEKLSINKERERRDVPGARLTGRGHNCHDLQWKGAAP